MARENQGLHIALIIFVALTLVLGVTTFMFFRKYEEASIKAKANEEQAKTERLKAENAEKDNAELKRLIGAGSSDNMDVIHEEFKKQMETYAANVEESARDYRKVLEYLFTAVRTKDTRIAELQVALQDEKTARELVEAIKQTQLDQYKTAQATAEKDLAEERGKFDEDRQAINQQKTALAQKFDKSQKDAVAVMDNVKQNLDEQKKRIGTLEKSLKGRSEELAKVTQTTFEAPDGQISWVRQRDGVVWVNLGHADGLTRQTTFAVYSADATDIAKAEKKADIEVTQVLGEHLAEARVIEDKIADPILPGDLVHTPIWTPGERQEFALTDGMDVDGDGKSDREIVRNLITMSGGVIVAELDDAGKRSGKMDTNTRFLILGRKHDENTTTDLGAARVKMLNEAGMLGVQTVELSELLKKMGWKNQTPVVRYGQGANPDDFRPRLPDGEMQRVSTGNVSPIFQPRNPPRSTAAGAY